MADSARVPATEITGADGGLLKMAVRRMVGRVPDSLGMMWRHPQVIKDLMGFGRKTEKWDRVDPNLAAYAAMAASRPHRLQLLPRPQLLHVPPPRPRRT